jgi:cytochrome c biogenesis protein CcmG/thiol:disulfide interchange protein DsbE
VSGALIARRRLLLLAPLAVAAAGGAAFWTMLSRMEEGRFDPHDIGNPMLGKPIPEFSLDGIAPSAGFSRKDVIAAAHTQPVLLNFFMSTCIPCAEEADTLAGLSKQGVPIWGIAWEDPADKAAAFLTRFGNPFARVAADKDGSTAINFGLYGVPESYLIDRSGRIVWHMAGALNDGVIEHELMPAFVRAKA